MRQVRELVGLQVHPAEHRGAGPLCHQPCRTEQCVLVRVIDYASMEAFEAALVFMDRRAWVGLEEVSISC